MSLTGRQSSLTSSPASMRPPRATTLESGDRLSRAEFHRRYEQASPHLKAELVEGVVYVSAAVRNRSHGTPHGHVLGCVATYCASTPGVAFADNATIRLDADNEVQPDVLMRLLPEHGGRCRESPDDYLEGPPELVIEVAASSASYDLHDKLNAYRRNGVREYLVWLVEEAQFACYRMGEEGELIPADVASSGGIFRSAAFPGFWLSTEALLAGDLRRALDVVLQGLASLEHEELVRRQGAIER